MLPSFLSPKRCGLDRQIVIRGVELVKEGQNLLLVHRDLSSAVVRPKPALQEECMHVSQNGLP